jgi:hypothetical protein
MGSEITCKNFSPAKIIFMSFQPYLLTEYSHPDHSLSVILVQKFFNTSLNPYILHCGKIQPITSSAHKNCITVYCSSLAKGMVMLMPLAEKVD